MKKILAETACSDSSVEILISSGNDADVNGDLAVTA